MAGLQIMGALSPPGTPEPSTGPYRGTMLPYSTDGQGNMRLDWSGTLLGRLLSAITAPYDAYTGQLPTPYSGGSFNDPTMINRALNFGSFVAPLGGWPGAAGVAAPSTVESWRSVFPYLFSPSSRQTVPGGLLSPPQPQPQAVPGVPAGQPIPIGLRDGWA